MVTSPFVSLFPYKKTGENKQDVAGKRRRRPSARGTDREEGSIVDTGTSGSTETVISLLIARCEKSNEVDNCGLPQALVLADGGANIGNTVIKLRQVPSPFCNLGSVLRIT